MCAKKTLLLAEMFYFQQSSSREFIAHVKFCAFIFPIIRRLRDEPCKCQAKAKIPRHCERSEAIQDARFVKTPDCFFASTRYRSIAPRNDGSGLSWYLKRESRVGCANALKTGRAGARPHRRTVKVNTSLWIASLRSQ